MTAPHPCPKCGYHAAAIVTASWSFTIARPVHSLNAHRGNYGGTRWAYKRDRDAWQWALKVERINLRIPSATTRRRVSLTRLFYGRERAFDVDNLIGGCKLIVDAMVREGLLLGDAAEHVELHHQQERGAASGLAVLIEEMANTL